MTPDRAQLFSAFLDDTEWASADRTPIAQDASSRSYTRLTKNGITAIAMDAPPANGEDVKPFVTMANALRHMNLAAPSVLACDAKLGFLILEDLGPTDFAKHLAIHPADGSLLYRIATDVLIHLQSQTPPALPVMTAERAGEMVSITAEWYVNDAGLKVELTQAFTANFRTKCGNARHLALRDFHAENLIWRPERAGLHRVGLLDFQDAFIAPAGYDLASLIWDARRDVPNDIAEQVIRQFANGIGEDIDTMRVQLAYLSAQRNLRILGVFGRLINRDGKHRYRAMLPRVWKHLVDDLSHPALVDLQRLVMKGIPHPDDLNFG